MTDFVLGRRALVKLGYQYMPDFDQTPEGAKYRQDAAKARENWTGMKFWDRHARPGLGGEGATNRVFNPMKTEANAAWQAQRAAQAEIAKSRNEARAKHDAAWRQNLTAGLAAARKKRQASGLAVPGPGEAGYEARAQAQMDKNMVANGMKQPWVSPATAAAAPKPNAGSMPGEAGYADRLAAQTAKNLAANKRPEVQAAAAPVVPPTKPNFSAPPPLPTAKPASTPSAQKPSWQARGKTAQDLDEQAALDGIAPEYDENDGGVGPNQRMPSYMIRGEMPAPAPVDENGTLTGSRFLPPAPAEAPVAPAPKTVFPPRPQIQAQRPLGMPGPVQKHKPAAIPPRPLGMPGPAQKVTGPKKTGADASLGSLALQVADGSNTTSGQAPSENSVLESNAPDTISNPAMIPALGGQTTPTFNGVKPQR